MSEHLFKLDGRTDAESVIMEKAGYVELEDFKLNVIRADGYFCGSCIHFRNRPATIPVNSSRNDGYCVTWKFRDRDYGCCNTWKPNHALIAS